MSISSQQLQSCLAIEDLTQSSTHAIAKMQQLLVEQLHRLYPPVQKVEGSRIVSQAENYDLLGYSSEDVTRGNTYTKWVDDTHLLRTQTTSLIVGALQQLSHCPQPQTLVAPGLVYRRDVRDRWHCAEPHQMDVWVVYPKNSAYDREDALLRLIKTIVQTSVPNTQYRILETEHHYTQQGKEVEIKWEGQWLEVLECGHIDPALLDRLGWDSQNWTGLALGMGLDRLVMCRKKLPDIRLLRDDLPLVVKQMENLDPWKQVSRQPAAERHLSLALDSDAPLEHITEQILEHYPNHAHWIESIEKIGVWHGLSLPAAALEKLGMGEHQVNVALKIVLRDLHQSIDRDLANDVARKIYKILHQGTSWVYCP